jgi:hypothetical protein
MTSDQRIALSVLVALLVVGGGIFLIVSVAGGDEEAVDLAEMQSCVEGINPYSISTDRDEWTPLSEHARDGFWVDFPVEDEGDDWNDDGVPDGWGVSVAVVDSEEAAAPLFDQIQDFYDGGITEDYAYSVGNVFFAWQGESSTEHPDVARQLRGCAT